MKNKFPIPALLLAALAVTGLSAVSARAQTVAPDTSVAPLANSVAAVTHLSGTLTVRRSDGTQRFLSVKSAVAEGDTLSTAVGTYARMKFSDGSEVVLRPESQLKVDAFKYEEAKPEADNSIISLLKGGLRSVTGLLGKRNRDKVSYNTPTATVGIRGTHFGALFCQNDCGNIPTPAGSAPPNGLHVDVLDGSVTVSNSAGAQTINAGQFGYVRDVATPPVQVPAQQGIQVTMPLAISRNSATGATVGKGREQDECAVR
jgi:hypothetical protein